MKREYPLALVMLQPEAMPGSYLNQGKTFREILNGVMTEAAMIAEMGFDGFILQNMHDGPVGQQARPETIAYMTRLGTEVRRAFSDLRIGVLVNWDGVASLAVAEAAEADFVRVEHLYTGVSIANCGFMSVSYTHLDVYKRQFMNSMALNWDTQMRRSRQEFRRSK